jgi:hypothetical protein
MKGNKALGSDLFAACSLMKKLVSVLSWLGALSDYQIPGPHLPHTLGSSMMSAQVTGRWRDAQLSSAQASRRGSEHRQTLVVHKPCPLSSGAMQVITVLSPSPFTKRPSNYIQCYIGHRTHHIFDSSNSLFNFFVHGLFVTLIIWTG